MIIYDCKVPSFAHYEIDESCHLYKVEVFDRKEDAEDGVHTTITGSLVQQDKCMGRNPSKRRTGVVLHFWSEIEAAPHDKFVMCIFQHKGGEYVKFMPLSEYLKN